MNKLHLQCKVVRDPELRYTQNEQTAIASFVVEFPDSSKENISHRLKVLAWGKKSDEAMALSKGDLLIVEGSLGINVVPREGFKDKVAELSASRIHRFSSGQPTVTPAPSASSDDEFGELDSIPF